MCADQYKTSYTLLERALELDDEAAWNTLTERYMTFVYYLLNQFELNEADCDDICQQVFIDLTSKLKQFDRERGNFRAWFSQLVKNKARRHLRQASTQQKYVNKEAEYVNLVNAFEESTIDTRIIKEWQDYLYSIVLSIVKKKYEGSGHMYEVFQYDMQGLSAPEIVQRTGLSIDSVYTFRTRIKNTLAKELASLKGDLEW